MWGFAKVALDLLASCLKDVESGSPAEAPALAAKAFEGKADRYGGVDINVPKDSAASVTQFATELKECLAEWTANGKRGIWFKVPLTCARFIASLTAEKFVFHHAKEDYVMLTRWLEDSPSKLPRYGFTQIGVGGCVVNDKDEVLMVQERIAPDAQFEGLWKLPGGLADPGEDLGDTARREVLEETGVPSEFVGVVSMRHQHGMRFGQGDMYCVLRLRALSDTIKVDPEEIADAKWMTFEEIQSRVPTERKPTMSGCVSSTTYKVIEKALKDVCIHGSAVPNTRGQTTMLYTASALAPSQK
jgi:8-oxo-dGTP pyrophosphatase MutT (NUDIX family)